MRHINEIIIHCSDSDVKSHDNIETIRRWHLEERGWSDIGYHYVITKNGEIYSGRKEEIVGAHCAGHNSNSIGICLTGKDPAKFTDKQYRSLAAKCKELLDEYESITKITGHYEYSDKQCPNFNIDTWKKYYMS